MTAFEFFSIIGKVTFYAALLIILVITLTVYVIKKRDTGREEDAGEFDFMDDIDSLPDTKDE